MPKVTVVMNCLNGERYLREAIDSVYAQTFDDWEIVFWDNSSTDNSGEIARSYGKKLRYFCADYTTTLGAARNKAFAEARGEFVAILDVDDIWLSQKLELQLQLFERDSELALTYTNSQYFDNTGDLCTQFDAGLPVRGNVFSSLLLHNPISTETMIFRKSALDDTSDAFDENFSIVMDYDLTLRIAYRYRIDYLDMCLSKWRFHAESETSRKKLQIYYELDDMLFKLRKDYPEIDKKYFDVISVFEKNRRFNLGKDAWVLGDIKEARSAFIGSSHRCIKVWFAYFGTWLYPRPLPIRVFKYLKNIWY